ncbi:FLZ-type domain-containing protein [Psidium guajava]|nr:FLZ-type domain-containing protein [Psidium guajava]
MTLCYVLYPTVGFGCGGGAQSRSGLVPRRNSDGQSR